MFLKVYKGEVQYYTIIFQNFNSSLCFSLAGFSSPAAQLVRKVKTFGFESQLKEIFHTLIVV